MQWSSYVSRSWWKGTVHHKKQTKWSNLKLMAWSAGKQTEIDGQQANTYNWQQTDRHQLVAGKPTDRRRMAAGKQTDRQTSIASRQTDRDRQRSTNRLADGRLSEGQAIVWQYPSSPWLKDKTLCPESHPTKHDVLVYQWPTGGGWPIIFHPYYLFWQALFSSLWTW